MELDWDKGFRGPDLEKATGDPEELRAFLREGEHQEQDFKFRIDSSTKIARTLSAFANTDGGRLLIGVKDNGKVTGIIPDEEYFMIEGAADLYCDPKVKFDYELFDYEDKLVLVIDVPPSAERPHFVKEKDGKRQAYIRQDDENFAANKVILRFLRDRKPDEKRKNLVAYGPAERSLFDLLSTETEISLSKFARSAKIPLWRAEKIMALFLKWGILSYVATDKGIRFRLKEEATD